MVQPKKRGDPVKKGKKSTKTQKAILNVLATVEKQDGHLESDLVISQKQRKLASTGDGTGKIPQAKTTHKRLPVKANVKRAPAEVHAMAAEFLEDGNYVQLETEGMHTEFLNEMEDSDGEEVTLADRGANNNAVLAEELSYQTQGAKGKRGSVQKGEMLWGRSTQQMNKV